MLFLGVAQLVFISRNTRKLFNRSWKEVEKFGFVQWGFGLFLLHFHRLTTAELIWFPAKEEQNGLSSCVSWLADVELNCLPVCSQCGRSSSLMMSTIITGLFSRQIPPVLRYTVPQVSVTKPEKSFCKGEVWVSGCAGKGGFPPDCAFPNAFPGCPKLFPNTCCLCGFGSQQPTRWSRGYSWLQSLHQADLQDSRLK